MLVLGCSSTEDGKDLVLSLIVPGAAVGTGKGELAFSTRSTLPRALGNLPRLGL